MCCKIINSASAIAGFFASFLSLPFDNAKTKMQKMKPNAEGVLPYKDIFDALKKVYLFDYSKLDCQK